MKHGKRYENALKSYDKLKAYTPAEAIETVNESTEYDEQLKIVLDNLLLFFQTITNN